MCVSKSQNIGSDRPCDVAPEATEADDDLESGRDDEGALRAPHDLVEFLRKSGLMAVLFR